MASNNNPKPQQTEEELVDEYKTLIMRANRYYPNLSIDIPPHKDKSTSYSTQLKMLYEKQKESIIEYEDRNKETYYLALAAMMTASNTN